MKIFIAIVLALAVCGCLPHYGNKVKVWDDFNTVKGWSDFRKICIEGHAYYTNGLYSGGIAPVLTDDGKPVKCEE
jgi:hypothetical protein